MTTQGRATVPNPPGEDGSEAARINGELTTLRLCLSPARRDFSEDKRASETLRRVFGLPGGHFIRHKKTAWYAVPNLPLGVAQSYVGLFRLFGVPDQMLEIAS